jgi:DNA modification methylase
VTVQIINGDCLLELKKLPENSVDSIVTDPPYGLSFMGKKWDYDVPSIEIWAECLRVLKPGGHLLAFAGTRTQHRMAVRIEDAGFEIRDMIAWAYGSGFPKSLDVSKAIDKMDASEARRERKLKFTEWMRGTGISPARIDEITGTNMGGHYTTSASQPAVATRELFEMLRTHFCCEVPEWVEKIVDERTVESENFKKRNVIEWVEMSDMGIARPACSYSAQNLDGVPRKEVEITESFTEASRQWQGWGTALKPAMEPITVARKPLIGTVAENVLTHGTGALNIDGCRVVTEGGTRKESSEKKSETRSFGSYLNEQAGQLVPGMGRWPANIIHDGGVECIDALGEASRFFYCPKASTADRGNGNIHPTVKPTDLMRYLCKLVTPPGGTVLDPFMGSGSTGRGAKIEWFHFIGIELDPEYCKIAEARINNA